MVKWFVGQKVKVLRASHPKNNGITGRITHIGPWSRWQRLPSGKLLDADSADCFLYLDSPRHDGAMVGANSFYQLESILPEGAQPLGYSFEQMMSEFGVTEAVK